VKRVVILGSGNGTNLSAIFNYVKEANLDIEIFAISDVENSGFLKRAKNHGIFYELIDRKLGREKQENMLFCKLKELSPDLIALAGYMRILPANIVDAFRWKIINLHPSLLPTFRGSHAIKDAFLSGVKWTGVTVHYVDEGLDTGQIIAQIPVPILNGDSLDTLESRIHEAEHFMYPRVIVKILGGEKFESAFECQRQERT